ncbi:ImmA/IrrE family metallo-endopeptidase [Acetobacteroides hydrogenigenes]|uniref:Uncharacterized protein DUF955 n=1 Tax=Acetobacteroides hydrogenigenes TaxID=979970 RepID=A0A4R2EHW9_9BACT|nr:ImmA/IrrE family metallo-endopeptidase [Acetobacteroides hydrogenigenes]TCN67677.1 uncharacterized protein DUF955 [Acetobacteroides hydrogenigenes]
MGKKKTNRSYRQTANESLDNLLRRCEHLKNNASFIEMLDFIAKFRVYKPFNNMLVFTQKPTCEFYATQKHWEKVFNRQIKPDSRPMVILAPMHPVLFVYDAEDTEGGEMPKWDRFFVRVSGTFKEEWYRKLVKECEKIRIDVKNDYLGLGESGYITPKEKLKYDIVVNRKDNQVVQFSTLIHELGHLFLGHLEERENEKYPLRFNLDKRLKELEAESVAYLFLKRLGLDVNSEDYLAIYNVEPKHLQEISVDLIVKAVGRIEGMIEPFRMLSIEFEEENVPIGSYQMSLF